MKILIKYSLMVFFIPFIADIAIIFVKDINIQLVIAVVGMVLTFVSTLYGKKKVQSFIKPSDEILQRMEIVPIPTSYVPDKYKISHKIFGYLTYVNVGACLFGYLAYRFSIIVPQPTGENAQKLNLYYQLSKKSKIN